MLTFLLRLLRRRLLIAALPALAGLAGAAFRWLKSRRRPATEKTDAPGSALRETTAGQAAHAITLHRIGEGERFDQAVASLRTQLGERAVAEPDESGFFEVEVEADSWDAAAAKLRDAIAAAGADDVVGLGEPSGRLRG